MRTAAVLGVVGLFAATAAPAQAPLPAEFPPASFTGSLYVDSTGCVYVRAGSGPMTEWIPRLTRARQHICGQTPTLGARATAAPVAAAAPMVAVPATPAPTPAPAPPVAATVAAPKTVSVRPVPAGYRPAWDDDRLNPMRAKGTAAGEAAMNRKWTQEVPRRLVTGG